MTNKESPIIFDVSHIVRDNYAKLEKDAHLSHIVFWIIFVPYIIAVVFSLFPLFVSSCKLEQSNYVISFSSIIIGFLINSAVMLKAVDTSSSLGCALKERTFANIFYTILVGILLVIVVIGGTWINPNLVYSINFSFIVTVLFLFYIIIMYFLFFHFIFMILIVMKAFYAVCR
ncbi:hypothetical protein MettiDRAFT_1696 [Methanolobus tindarius DSM 2278]|uniref:Uncharacterized protein n=1 Tax=Methanolobus tindarius DSM 2278 TaxID=1090322 RepID=W9DX31_METTI|nr:hypothetical protein [Methanolobus tindarius]ETA68242.1 hypothetical protein MettiDRAFT_1696 [Methanolobus tindarius DSM 2278]